jgi:flagellar biosynthesis protein FlhG
MHDQAFRLRDLVRRTVELHPPLAPAAPVVVVSGGRPGAGAAVLTCQLGRELARLGKRVALVDADPAGPALTQRLAPDFSRQTRGCLADVAAGRRRAAETLAAIDDRLRLLPGFPAGGLAAAEAADMPRLLREIKAVGEAADLVLVDAGGGMSPWVDQCWQLAEEILLVSRHDAVSVREAYRTIKLARWQQLQHRLRLVIEGEEPTPRCAAAGERLAATCRDFLALEVRGCSGVTTRGREAWGRSASPTAEDPQFVRSVRLLATDLLCDDGLGAASPRAAG